ncbi:hypothetical protein LAZ67_9000803 [Cordylochernes scorpioides]|uniref:Reverse transcriptase domain-containing protein n=1 Tax=Cordylochernes scorpioides TaxID=51811 RepID=A0ABY6KVG6_9ARAC|nr:hypothetical protein LAZ67_9000803 [Cordylochernes scorpioides]
MHTSFRTYRPSSGMSTFTFDTQFFKQTKGSPMGSPLSTVVAEVVMRSLDQWITSRHSSDIFLWRRYIDDTFCLGWQHHASFSSLSCVVAVATPRLSIYDINPPPSYILVAYKDNTIKCLYRSLGCIIARFDFIVLEIPPPTRLISRNPVWVADENVDLKEEWRNRWSNLAIANKDLVEDPNTKPPGYNLPRRTWSTLNRIRTSTGRCNYLLNKWNMSPDQNCDCGQIQTMHHILRDCPRRFFQGTLGDIHRCTEEALEWIRHLDIPL